MSLLRFAFAASGDAATVCGKLFTYNGLSGKFAEVKLPPTAIGTATDTILAGLERIGYAPADGLLARNYAFPDWFADQQIRTLDAAAFGRAPISYESSCIAVAKANDLREQSLVNTFRAFAAPILLEIDHEEVREWAVSADEDKHTLIGKYPVADLQGVIATRAHDWSPEVLLRAKNIQPSRTPVQRDLFAGLIPELEDQIQTKLDILLRDTLNSTRDAYVQSSGKPASPRALFKVVFWILTAKVFHDRRVPGFASLDGDPSDIFRAVSRHYKVHDAPPLNREARTVAATNVWNEFDFRNLSVDVLAHIWSRTLVDKDTRRKLGIHRTPRAIVRYIVDRLMPFASSGGDTRIVFEPCSGSAAFLIGALNYMRSQIPMASATERHAFFVNHLASMEKDPFGAEISRFALTLADFPNPNGWDVNEDDVFRPNAMTPWLQRASIVLCNPPFQRFTDQERREYRPTFVRKPAELLHRVMADLHPRGVMGFVLPYIAVDGREYADTRRALASRFGSIDITVLPERSFEGAPTDIALMIATDPIPHVSTKLSFRKVDDTWDAWNAFQRDFSASFEDAVDDLHLEGAGRSVGLPDLPEVWRFLEGRSRLGEFANIHIGVQWHAPFIQQRYVRDHPADGFTLGVPPNAKIETFKQPQLKYLNVETSKLRRPNVLQHPWEKPKVIVPKARQSRGKWRIAAYVDRLGVVCNQAFQGVWPTTKEYDEVFLAAILNGPVANAFVSTHEGNRDVTGEVLEAIPMPRLTTEQKEQLHQLVAQYESSLNVLPMAQDQDQERLLKEIDALVLEGYGLPPRLERQLLDYSSDGSRAVSHKFSRYFPMHFDLYVSLSQFISERFKNASIGRMLERFGAR